LPTHILNLGVSGQKGLAEFNEKLINNSALAQAGTGGEILKNLLQIVALVNPAKKSFLYALIGKNDTKSRISRLTASLDRVSPAIEYLSETLSTKIQEAQQYIIETGDLLQQNAKWMSHLRVVNAALVIAIERDVNKYEKMREGLGENASFDELEKLKTAWNDLQRLDRRRGAIQASFGLSVKIHMQLSQIREQHLYDIEMLKEADEFLIPSWHLEIRTQISAMNSEGHL
jgi:uncharacterized protein YaaN involved in tellurite resistance